MISVGRGCWQGAGPSQEPCTHGQQRAVLLPQSDLTFPCSKSEALSCTQVLRAGARSLAAHAHCCPHTHCGLGCPSFLPPGHHRLALEALPGRPQHLASARLRLAPCRVPLPTSRALRGAFLVETCSWLARSARRCFWCRERLSPGEADGRLGELCGPASGVPFDPSETWCGVEARLGSAS